MYHTIAIYVPNKYVLKCHIYAKYSNYLMCWYETTVSVYRPCMKSLQWTVWPEALVYIHFTYLAYALEHACYIAYIYLTAWLLYSTHWPNMPDDVQKNWNFYVPCYCHICAGNTYATQISHICHTPKLFNVHQRGKYTNNYATYELTCFNCVTNSTAHRWQCWQ